MALVEEDWGHLASLEVAKALILFLKRPGVQSQLSASLNAQIRTATSSTDERFRALHAWICSRLSEKLGVDQLAQFVGMSARNFYRNYAASTGMTPGKALEALRLEAACRELKSSTASIKRIAMACGFGNEERMRRVFLRHYGMCPARYRAEIRGQHATAAS